MEITLQNNYNNGTLDYEIDIDIDIIKQLKVFGNISTDYDKAVSCPVTIYFMLCHNASIRIKGISAEHLYWTGVEDGISFYSNEENGYYSFFWRKSITNIERDHVILIVDGLLCAKDAFRLLGRGKRIGRPGEI